MPLDSIYQLTDMVATGFILYIVTWVFFPLASREISSGIWNIRRALTFIVYDMCVRTWNVENIDWTMNMQETSGVIKVKHKNV